MAHSYVSPPGLNAVKSTVPVGGGDIDPKVMLDTLNRAEAAAPASAGSGGAQAANMFSSRKYFKNPKLHINIYISKATDSHTSV